MKRIIGFALLCVALAACGSANSATKNGDSEPEGTRFEQAYDACVKDGKSANMTHVADYIEVADQGTSVLIDGPYEETTITPDVTEATACILVESGMPEYVGSQMENTTSLMGVQEAEWDGVSASWSYHPDNGFDVVLHEA